MLRKPIFGKRLERSAKDKAREVAKTVRFWFRRRYVLPETDDRYLAMTDEMMLADYWSHFYYEKPESEFEASSDDFEDQVAELMQSNGQLVDDFEDVSNG